MASTDNHTLPPTDRDLNYTSDDLIRSGGIAAQIGFIDDLVDKDYTKYDQDACRDQRYHLYFAHAAVLSGTMAIIIALLQVTGFLPKQLSLPGETIASLLSVIAVFSGTVWAFQKRWLLERYKAESLRILKFKALVQFDFLCGNIEAWRLWLEGEIGKIRNLEKDDIHRIIKSGGNTRIPVSTTGQECDDSTVVAVAEYYRKNLISTQIQYFRQKANEQESSDRFIRHLPHLFFFFGVVMVASHFIIDELVHESDWYSLSNILIFLGIAFPVTGIGIRTYRSSHEFARSASIFRANENRLLEMEAKIASLLREQPGNKMQILSILNVCEEILEEEHYEWLRLMVESEWFI
jgi:hypothetical protein